MTSEVLFRQVNLHRAFLAATELKQKVQSNPTVCLLTEPYQTKNRLAELPQNHVCFPSTIQQHRPRTAIFVPSNIPHVFLKHLSGQDITVVLLNTECGKLLIASIYLDSDDLVVPEWLTKLMDYIDEKNLPSIIGFDSNAHSTLYGPDTNARGKRFEDFIMQHNLHVENVGHEPTYHAFRYDNAIGTCIDVTISKGSVPVLGWYVDTEFNGSDHHTLRWSVPLSLPQPPMIRPWKTAKWDVFTKSIEAAANDFTVPTNLTTRKIDKLLDRVYHFINTALDIACPLREAKLTPKETKWFGKDQARFRNRTKRKYDAYRRDPTPGRRKAFVSTRRSYHKSCRKAKRSSWREFVEKTPNENNMAILAKIAQRKERRSITALRKPDNSLSEPGMDTIQVLVDTHFPAATVGVNELPHDNSHKFDTTVIQEAFKDWINTPLVRKAMKKFKPHKAAGPDNIKPIVLKYLPTNVIDILTLIFQGCIALRHTPTAWRRTKVIFLPKPGKEITDVGKAYRPISLSNFPLKTLERLVSWKMEDDLTQAPLNAHQHGFRKGKSTESAISRTVNYIEQQLFENSHCLAVFLDISSAFDSISIEHIRDSLLKHNGDPDMVDWYYKYLQNRYLEIELQGHTASYTTGVGFPQGGVCSAHFWLIAFNEAINIINSGNIVGTGYADDCSALLGGRQTHNMVDAMQSMLERLIQWGLTCNLRFNPQKTVVVMFTRSKRDFTRQIRMDGHLIPYSTSAVYLGVTLDYRLFWTEHIKLKIQKAKRLLMKLSSITTSYWGPKPKLLRWAYTGMVRPIVLYASMVWAHEANNPAIETALRRLNRLALNTIVKIPRSTPTRTVEIILDVPPLHLVALKEGLAAYQRLKPILSLQWEGVYQNLTHSTSHLKAWEVISNDLGLTNNVIMDACSVRMPYTNFTVDSASFNNMLDCQSPANINVYTDGSKMHNKVGAGVYIERNGDELIKSSTRLPDQATVFQAEIMAIKEAAESLTHMIDLTHIKFYVDSQAALKALQTDTITSQLVLQTVQTLNKIQASSLTFVWTKAHVGTKGNEAADQLAKEGTNLPNILNTPLARTAFKSTIDTYIRRRWDHEWNLYGEARQSKIFITSQSKETANRTIQWNRLQLGRYIRAVTGHNNLLYHLFNMDNTISPACRFCWESYEEFQHLAYHCPALWWERHNIEAQDPEHATCWTPEQVLAFSLTPKLDDAFSRPLFHINENYDPDELRSQRRTQPVDTWSSDSQESALQASTISSTSEDSPPSSPIPSPQQQP